MTEHSCDVCFLFDPKGPDDPAWLARVRAEATSAPVLIEPILNTRGRWATDYDCCRICGSATRRHTSRGRCTRCQRYQGKYGVERPAHLLRKDRAS